MGVSSGVDAGSIDIYISISIVLRMNICIYIYLSHHPHQIRKVSPYRLRFYFTKPIPSILDLITNRNKRIFRIDPLIKTRRRLRRSSHASSLSARRSHGDECSKTKSGDRSRERLKNEGNPRLPSLWYNRKWPGLYMYVVHRVLVDRIEK